MVNKPAFISALASIAVSTAMAETYSMNDFKTKLFWKRPPQGKPLI